MTSPWDRIRAWWRVRRLRAVKRRIERHWNTREGYGEERDSD